MKVGITGHQELGSAQETAWLRSALTGCLSDLNPDLGVSCLAKGADQLFALILGELGVPLLAVIPCATYDETFDEQVTLSLYQSLLIRAAQQVKLHYTEPSEEAFWEAGKQVVDRSDLLIAIWNGEKAKGLGGTGDVVAYALQSGSPVVHIHPTERSVKSIHHG